MKDGSRRKTLKGAHLAFIGIPAWGHINPTLGLVAELVRQGARVTYAVTKEFAPALKAVGAFPLIYRSTIIRHSADIRFLMAVFRETAFTLPRLETFYGKDRPDLILYDYFGWAGKVLAARFKIPAIRLNPIYASNAHFSLLDSLLRSTHPAQAEFRAQFESYLDRVGLHGMSFSDFIRRPEKMNIVFFPRILQPAGDTFNSSFIFAGPCLDKERAESAWKRPPGGRPLLLVSLGTLFNEWPEFFRMCVKAFSGSAWNVIMAYGKNLRRAELGRLPANIAACRYVPQLRILADCDAFISHGGMNSTIEALYYGRPMVVIPQMYEQRFIARRLEELGLAISLSRGEVTSKKLRECVRRAVENRPMRERINKMRLKLKGSGGARKAALEIEKFLRDYRA
ncbi:MAG: hypothetical protein A2X34_03220 [Elusimicrobia bacterium GWC2_51_8]|nr:MAG: hypothetical protein A2X33_06105 [Elusimicrobia bacterium GWA2_51_34]OGR61983.1 MAG: hypothetical protein A2X34_03220 [Elusimicrobia bacterium GWC2_51_8]OGR85231.1 MAG: hypothetical protein A2021_00470 [Elusimicrobia bacterium GWF2_52_66]